MTIGKFSFDPDDIAGGYVAPAFVNLYRYGVAEAYQFTEAEDIAQAQAFIEAREAEGWEQPAFSLALHDLLTTGEKQPYGNEGRN
jgi:hypothetical protein